LVSTLVSEDLEAPSMFDLRLVTWDLAKQEITLLSKIGTLSLLPLGFQISKDSI
jgi:hypothetical protein